MRLPRNSIYYLVLILAPSSPGWTQDFRGSLIGNINDTSGARVPSAVITIRASDSSIERQTKSDDRGEFRFSDLAPANYRVTVQASGFADAVSTVTVNVSSVRDITVTLNPAPSQQRVNVSAAPSSITAQPMDTASAVDGGVVTARDLDTLPLADRSFANIAYLVPGTEPVEPSDPTKARITAVSFGGSSGLNDVNSRWTARDNRTITSAASCRISRPMRFRNSPCSTSQEECGHRPHRGRFGRDHHQERHQRVARRRRILRARRGAQCALSRSRIPRRCPSSRSPARTTSARSAVRS